MAPEICTSPLDLSLGLRNTHVLVTGGAGLIGSVIVAAFLSAGCNVTSIDLAHTYDGLIDRREGDAGRLLTLRTDITDQPSVQQAFELATAHFGHVQTCICLAGLDLSVLSKDGLLDGSISDWKKVLDINVLGSMTVAQAWLKGIQSSTAANLGLILTSSECALFGSPSTPIYATSKAALHGLMYSLAQEAPRIHPYARVNAVAPGPVDTDRFRQECADDPDQLYVDSQATVPLGRPVPVEDVAKMYVVIASANLSGSVHGQIVRVDGGKGGNLAWKEGEVDRTRMKLPTTKD